jgi:cysteine desulfurase
MIQNNMDDFVLHYKKLKSCLLTELINGKFEFNINGSVEKRIPNNLNIAIAGKVSEQLFNFMPHIALSSGSACTSGTIERSHVLSSMKLQDHRIDGSFRISFGRSTTKEEIKELISIIEKNYHN